MNLEEIEDKLNSEIHRRDKLIIDLNKVNENLYDLMVKKNELDPSMVRVVCIQCNGLGRVAGEDGRKRCPLCRGEEYTWMKLYIPRSGESND